MWNRYVLFFTLSVQIFVFANLIFIFVFTKSIGVVGNVEKVNREVSLPALFWSFSTLGVLFCDAP
jgi:lipid-A-disaccharide synthase-like uncharacterized protein